MMSRAEKFRKYLGNSLDVDAIILEVDQMPLFDYLAGEVCCTNALYDLVRDVWDAAYSHGVQDALADAGLTLEEIMESGE